MDEKEDEDLDYATQRDYLLGEEITGVERRRMPLQKVSPGTLAAFRTRVEAMLLQDVLDSRLGDRTDAELLKLPNDSGVTPARLASHAHDPVPDLVRRAWPTRLPLSLR